MAEQYTSNPGPRYISQGPNSGEDFRESVLKPFFKNKTRNEKLIINLDGLNGYPSSFFEEAFGGIARDFSVEDTLNALDFECNDNPIFIEDIKSYIKQERA